MSNYSGRVSKPVGASANAMGGCALNMAAECLNGQTDMVTIFDDFNSVITNETGAGTSHWEVLGWTIVGIGTQTATKVGMNDIDSVEETFRSCIRIGTDLGSLPDRHRCMASARYQAWSDVARP